MAMYVQMKICVFMNTYAMEDTAPNREYNLMPLARVSSA